MDTKRSLEIYRCVVCKQNALQYGQTDVSNVHCNNCGQSYDIKSNILDTLVDPPPYVVSELQGIAQENGIDEKNYQKLKIRHINYAPTLEDKLAQTFHDRQQYYQQTTINFTHIFDSLEVLPKTKVLEIGATYDYYFLKYFHEREAKCYAINLHFEMVKNQKFFLWPEKTLADMNNLPFDNGVFDFIIISSTSHHSPTPEILISEISRVLKYKGKCLMINDPLKGIIKSWGGNYENSRHSKINENQYTLWRYNKIFKINHLHADHFFSPYHDMILSKRHIHPQMRFALIAKFISILWSNKILRHFLRKYFTWLAQALFGLPLNVLLTKSRENKRNKQ